MQPNPPRGATGAQPKPSDSKRRCPSCGREADALFHPIHRLPGEGPDVKNRPLVCPACCPLPPDETKT